MMGSKQTTAFSTRRNWATLGNPHRHDGLVEFIMRLLNHSFVLDALDATVRPTWLHIEELVEEHRAMMAAKEDFSKPHTVVMSRLADAVPSISVFHTPLHLLKAWEIYDAKYQISSRRYVQPSFNEVRHLLNLGQILAMREQPLRLVTFDGDCTLYSNGNDFSDPKLARFIMLLMRQGVHIALVTAAGYAYDPSRYQWRLSGLLRYFAAHKLPAEIAARFWVLGGECNYLLQCAPPPEPADGAAADGPDGPPPYVLVAREEQWRRFFNPDPAAVTGLLDEAERCLTTAIEELQLRGRLIRKGRAIGLVPGGKKGKEAKPQGTGSKAMPNEALDEVVLRCQADLRVYVKEVLSKGGPEPPQFCAFNGGNDAWVDIGDKSIGVKGLCEMLEIPGRCTLHIGDQFHNTGNDYAARGCCPCLWIIHPLETRQVLKSMLREALQLPNASLKETMPEIVRHVSAGPGPDPLAERPNPLN